MAETTTTRRPGGECQPGDRIVGWIDDRGETIDMEARVVVTIETTNCEPECWRGVHRHGLVEVEWEDGTCWTHILANEVWLVAQGGE